MPRAPASASTDPGSLPEESRRLLVACAGISSLAQTAIAEGTAAAAPFLGFAQKARIRALSTRFDGGRSADAVLVQPPPAPVPAVGGGLDAEEVERIVAHRVEAALRQAMAERQPELLRAFTDTMERRLETSGAEREAKIAEYVKRQLDDLLEMFESMLDERLRAAPLPPKAEEPAVDHEDVAAAREEVDRRVNEAREALLKDIDEVRTVDVGFNIDNFAADMAAAMAEQDVGGATVDEVMLDDQEEDVLAEAAAEDELAEGPSGIEASADEDSPEEAAEREPGPPVEVAQQDAELENVEDLEIDLASSPAIELSEESIAGSAAPPPGPEEAQSEEAETEPTPALDLSHATFGAGSGNFGATVAVAEDLDENAVVDLASDAVELDLEGADGAAFEAIGAQVAGTEPNAAHEDAMDVDEDAIEIDVDSADDVGDGRRVELDLHMPLEEHPDIEIALDDGREGADEVVSRYLQRAAEMRLRKQTAAAMELYNKVLDMDPRNYEAHIGRGAVHLESRDFKRAADEFTLAEEIDPQRPASALGLAEVHFYRKQFNKAIRHYTQCLQLDDRLAQAYCNRGLSYYYQKNYKKAFLDLMRAYELDPDLPNIRKYLKLVKNKVKAESEGGAVDPVGE